MTSGEIFHGLLIAGFGGQGVVLAGRLLATAALAEGREVAWAPSYGPEMRGGPVHCSVIVSSRRIGSPEVSQADSLVIMDNASLERCRYRLKPGGLLILNTSLASAPDDWDCELIKVPANEAAEALEEPRVANVLMLGAFLGLRPIVAMESVIEAMRLFAGKSREHLLAVNVRALARGAEIATRSACPP